MAYPVEMSYEAESGATMYIGCEAPVVLPLWLQGAGVNEWVEILGTSGADGQNVNAWCDFALKQSTAEVILALHGGHDDDWRTAVSSISLLDDAPAWPSPRRRDSIDISLRNYSGSVGGVPPPNAESGGPTYPYCKDDVTPSSRHNRYQSHHCPQNDRVMLIGSPALYGYGGSNSGHSNGFDLATNEWDAPGTWVTAASGSTYGTEIDDLGNIWARTHKFILATNTLASLPTTYANTSAFDTSRRKLFTLCRGDGQGFSLNLGIVAKTINEDLSGWQTITFNASAGYTAFEALNLSYCAMTYDATRDKFYFYDGYDAGAGVVFVITPNGSTVWDMDVLTLGGGSATPGSTTGAGINGRFKYSTALDGVVMMPTKASNIFFLRLGS